MSHTQPVIERIPEELLRPKVFGTDGARGEFTADQTPGDINTTTAQLLARATAEMLADQTGNTNQLAVLAHDPRESSKELLAATAAGIREVGGRVINLGMVPTPLMFWVARHLKADVTGMVTASHNPAKDNGLKLGFGADKLQQDQTDEVERRFWQIVDGLSAPLSSEPLAEEPVSDQAEALINLYIDSVVGNTQAAFGGLEHPFAGNRYVFDGANGAASYITPKILEKLGATVDRFACNPGSDINNKCGATDLSGVQQYLRDHPEIVRDPQFKGAISHDGDADRIMCMGAKITDDGTMAFSVLDGNHALEIMAEGQEGVVGTDYTNRATVKRLQQKGLRFIFCPNGDINVTIALKANNLTKGAEFTGHLVDLDHGSSGDGPYMAAQIAAAGVKQNKTIYELCEEMPLWPEKMVKLKLPGVVDESLLAARSVRWAIGWAKLRVGRSGAVLVRPSGTEKGVMRVWANGENAGRVVKNAERIGRTITRAAHRQATKSKPMLVNAT